MHPLYLILIFVIATGIGYVLIKKVPALLHTPLMSGMNALSGVTIIGAITSAGLAFIFKQNVVGQLCAALAIILATINVVGGFGVTHRMLKMFKSKPSSKKDTK